MRALAIGGLLAAGAGVAAAAPAEPDGRVIFAREGSLWMTDGRGKATATRVARLPAEATDVRYLRSDAAGTTLLADLSGRWFWARIPVAGEEATLTALPCGGGTARLSPGGEFVLCGTASGTALIVRLRDGQTFERADASAAGAAIIDRGGTRELVWAAGGAIVASALKAGSDPRTLAPQAPVRGLVIAPDGSRAVGVYLAPPRGQPRTTQPREQLFGFPLDGTTARRRLIRDGVVLDWSWDATWLLIQDGGKACIARAVGGEYKCWKGYTAVSLAPDGAWALLLGPRDGAAPAEAPPAPVGNGGEGADGGDGEVDDAAVPLPTGPLSLYRAKLAGTYSERPALIETVVDGAALWLPPQSATAPVDAAPDAAAPLVP